MSSSPASAAVAGARVAALGAGAVGKPSPVARAPRFLSGRRGRETPIVDRIHARVLMPAFEQEFDALRES